MGRPALRIARLGRGRQHTLGAVDGLKVAPEGHHGSVKVTRYGHAALLVDVAGIRILIDPGIFSTDEAFDLTGLNAIIVTHQHADHVDPSRLPRLLEGNTGAVLLSSPETIAQLEVGDWTENADGKETDVGAVVIRGVGVRHAEITPQLPRVDNIGILVASPGEPTLFHPGDSYEYAPDDVTVLALPLSAPWAKVSETIDFVRRVAPRTLFPIHDRTIADVAYPMYWGHSTNFGGVEDARLLGQTDSAEFSL